MWQRCAKLAIAVANELSLMTPRILARLNAGRTGRVKQIRWVAAGLTTK